MRTTLPVDSQAGQPNTTPTKSWVFRFFSLSGVLPLVAFTLVHTAVNARILWSDAAFARTLASLARIPALAFFEWALVLLPLAFHGAVGLWLVATDRSLPSPSPYPPAIRTAVRWTGVGAFAFIAMHCVELVPRAHAEGGELATIMAASLSATSHGVPWRGFAYLAGIACVSFHMAASAWGALAASGPGRANEALRRAAAWGAGGAGVCVSFVLGAVVVFHATGARAFGAAEDALSREPCPAPASSAAAAAHPDGGAQ